MVVYACMHIMYMLIINNNLLIIRPNFSDEVLCLKRLFFYLRAQYHMNMNLLSIFIDSKRKPYLPITSDTFLTMWNRFRMGLNERVSEWKRDDINFQLFMGLIGELKKKQRNKHKEFLCFSYLFNDSKNRYSKLKRIHTSGKCEVRILLFLGI